MIAYMTSHAKAANKCINADRFYTPRHFVLLCVKPSGYAERYAKKTVMQKKQINYASKFYIKNNIIQ